MVKYINRAIILKICFRYNNYIESINKKLIINYLKSVFLSSIINNRTLILNSVIFIFNYLKRIDKLLILKLLNSLESNLNLKFLSRINGTGVRN